MASREQITHRGIGEDSEQSSYKPIGSGKYHAFIIGINKYQNAISLDTPINDADALADVLATKYEFKPHSLYNPTGDILRGYLEDMIKKVGEKDAVLFYFAGHGKAVDNEKGLEGFILPADADIENDSTLIPMSFLLGCFEKLPCRHFLLILDCCFAGSFRWAVKYRDSLNVPDTLFQQHYRYYSEKPSWQVLTSVAHTQKALDHFGNRGTTESKHSPFAQCLLEGLEGQADVNSDKIITTAELYAHLQKKIPIITGEAGNLQNVGFFPLKKHDNGEFMFLPKGFDPDKDLKKRHYKNPYMGLKAYSSNDVGLFFGREKASQELLKKVKDSPFTVVVGASGTGKSSLVKAGILPFLKKKEKLKVVEMRPGKDPISALPNYDTYFDVLFIDQFEEIITQSDEQQATELMKILRGYIAEKKKKIILTVRIDFESQINKAEIAADWQKGRYLIPPFTPEELREVIITPSARVGRFIDDESLVSEIVTEVVHYPGSLPLLSFTLSALFEQCKGNPFRNIRYEDYKKLGGITGSLQKSGDEVLTKLLKAEKHTLRNIMLRMISITGGEMAGKRLLLRDLVFADADEKQRVENVIKKLLEARLIVSNSDTIGQPYIEPAHDALIRAWGKLHEWIKAFGDENLYLFAKLHLAVTDYNQNSSLWDRNPSLKQALNLKNTEGLFFNSAEASFIQKSYEKEVDEIEALKAERDEAVRQKLLAEKQARAANNLSFALQTQESNPTLSSNILYFNTKRHPKDTASALQLSELLNDSRANFFLKDFKTNQNGKTPVVFSPNGQNILVGCKDGVARLWDLNGHEIQVFKGHKEWIWSVAFSPDGKKILTGSGDKTAKLWGLDGYEIQTFKDYDSVRCVVFSPDGTKILTGNDGKTAKLWDMAGNIIKTFNSPFTYSATFSPDSKYLLTASNEGTARLWDLNGFEIQTFNHNQYGYPLVSVAFSPNGKDILTGSRDNTAKLWDLDGHEKQVFKGHQDTIETVTFSPDGTSILTGSADMTAKLWDLKGNEIYTFRGHQRDIYSVGFSPDTQSIITSCLGGTVRLWNLKNKIRVIDVHSSVLSVVFSPNGETILTGHKDWTAKLWDLEGNQLQVFKGHQLQVNSVAFSPNGKYILTGSEDWTAKLWDLLGNEIQTFNGHKESVNSVAFLPYGQNIITGSGCSFLCQYSLDLTARLWSIEGKEVHCFNQDKGSISSIAISPDGTSVLAGISDFTAQLWDLMGNIIWTYHGHKDVVNSVAFSPDGKYVLTGSKDKTVKLWDLKGHERLTFTGHLNSVNSVAFSLDGKSILTGSDDKTAKMWDLLGNEIQTFNKHKDAVNAVAFSPNGKYILTGSKDGTVNLYKTCNASFEDDIYQYTLLDLKKEGLKLEPTDLLTLWEQGEQLTEEELRLMNKK